MKDEKKLDTQAPLTISTEQLLQLLAESRKPVFTEEDIRKQAQEKEARREEAALQAVRMQNSRNKQKICTHMRDNGKSRVVYVQSSHYLLCLKCQAVIRPGPEPNWGEGAYAKQKNALNAIYDTDMFNRLIQLANTNSDIHF